MTEYQWYLDALDGRFGELTLNKAEPGFYRYQERGVGPQPLAVWLDGDRVLYRIANREERVADERFCENVFSWGCKAPITDELYWSVMEGGPWPDKAPEPKLNNLPDDPHERLKLLIEAEREEAERFLAQPLADKAASDRAADWANRMLRFEQEVNEHLAEERKPHERALATVRERWKPLSAVAEDLKKRLKEAVLKWQRAEKARLAEEAAKAAAAGEVVRPIRVASGNVGRKVSARIEKHAVIDDWDAALIALRGNPELRELVQKICDRAARAGAAVPGTRIVETEKAA